MIAVLWEVQCDFPGCTHVATYDGAKSMTEVRRLAAKDGWGAWSAGEQGNFCPDHKNLYSKQNWTRARPEED